MQGENEAVIYAVDEADETWYVLIREGQAPVAAAWPTMLEDLCPTAIRGGTLGSYELGHRNAQVNGCLEDHLMTLARKSFIQWWR